MEIVRTVKEMQLISNKLRAAGKSIACVPTMGYLHEGHISLITRANEIADISVATLFVNPTQFAPNEDFSRYPRDFDRDCSLCKDAGLNYLFAPSESEMYPSGYNTEISIKGISDKFEGVFRPIHINGVATVVAKLFNAVRPDMAVFGQKDYQQTLVVKQMVRDMLMGVSIVVAPTVREEDGLAKSSRNIYLNPEQRQIALTLYNALKDAISAIESGEKRRKVINGTMHNTIRTAGAFQIDYASSADATNLDEPEEFVSGQKIVLLIAAYLGKTRLIDNYLVTIQ